MNVKRIELEDGDDDRISRVTVVLTLPEVVYLAQIIGSTTYDKREEVMRGGGDAGASIYDCLTGAVLNRYYENGVHDAVRDLARGGES